MKCSKVAFHGGTMIFRIKMLTVIAVALLVFPVVSQSQSSTSAQFDKLKLLVGEWQSKSPDGHVVHVSYRLASAGFALMETIKPEGGPEMVTVYHRDGDSVMLTHYCAAGNQPRMRALPASGAVQQLNFNFVDASNLSTPTAGHMDHLVLTFEDANHVTEKWTWKEGAHENVEEFHLARMD
jgi:hypothetical protein